MRLGTRACMDRPARRPIDRIVVRVDDRLRTRRAGAACPGASEANQAIVFGRFLSALVGYPLPDPEVVARNSGDLEFLGFAVSEGVAHAGLEASDFVGVGFELVLLAGGADVGGEAVVVLEGLFDGEAGGLLPGSALTV